MKVLLVRTDRMGDVILSTPVATLLKKAHPAWQVDMLVPGWLAPLVRVHRDVDRVLKYHGESAIALARRLRAEGYEAAVLLHPRLELAFGLWLAGIPRRIGTRYRAYSFMLNERVPVRRKKSGLHELELNVATAAPLGPAELASCQDLFPFEIPAEARREMERKVREAGLVPGAQPVVLHPGSGGSARDWPVKRFAELARLVHRENLGPVVITGTAPERQLVDSLVAQAGVPCVRLDGSLSVLELAALLEQARVVVANSTGPLHLAVAMKAPVVGLYCPIGPCHPRRWGPYGRPGAVVMPDVPECDRCTPECPHYDCMESITAEQVLAKIVELLDAGPNIARAAGSTPAAENDGRGPGHAT